MRGGRIMGAHRWSVSEMDKLTKQIAAVQRRERAIAESKVEAKLNDGEAARWRWPL